MLKPRIATVDTSTAKVPEKQAAAFYSTAEWRELVARLKRTRGERCEKCPRHHVRLFGDHITELEDGGAPLDARNVQLLCGSCHTAKTVRARAERMRARH